MLDGEANHLLQPTRVLSRADILSTPCPVAASPGAYAWYFKTFPPSVPVHDCVRFDDLTLLYVGISPKKPPARGKPSSHNLRKRIQQHLRGNAKASTLRLTLGCLLSEQLGIQLRRVGTGRRMTFGAGEHILSQWMADNAFVVWVVTPAPWMLEEKLLNSVSLPLNLQGNRDHPFSHVLSEKRREARALARRLPILGPDESLSGPDGSDPDESDPDGSSSTE